MHTIVYIGCSSFFFFFQAEDGIRDYKVTGVQTCALPISGEQLERHDPHGVDVAARVQRLPPDLLGAHELGGAEDDPGRRELRDGGVDAPLLGEAEVHHHGPLPAAVLGHEHDVLRLQVPVHDLQLVRVVQPRADLAQDV